MRRLMLTWLLLMTDLIQGYVETFDSWMVKACVCFFPFLTAPLQNGQHLDKMNICHCVFVFCTNKPYYCHISPLPFIIGLNPSGQ